MRWLPARRVTRSWLLLPLAGIAVAGLLLEVLLRVVPGVFPPRIQQQVLSLHLWKGIFLPDPELGVVLSVPFERTGTWMGGPVRIRHRPMPGDSRAGYRTGAEGDEPERAEILVLGDSHAYGPETDEDETWESVLSRDTGLRVVNLGLPWQGMAQQRILYRRFGTRFRARLVLIMVCPNDFWDDMTFRAWLAQRDGGESDYRFFSLGIALSCPDCPGLLLRTAHLATRSRLLRVLLFNRLISSPNTPSRPRMALMIHRSGEAAARVEALLSDTAGIVEAVRAGGARSAVVLTDLWGWGDGGDKALLKRGLRRRGIPFFDMGAEMCSPKGCPQRYMLPDRIHWNVKGQRRASKKIELFLREKRLLPARRAP